MPKVLPNSRSDAESGAQPQADEGFWGWVRAHAWMSAALVFLAACIIVIVIVVPVCTVVGCPKKDNDTNKLDFPPGLPRLLVNYLGDINATELIPPILRQYVTNLQLDTSNIQILDFIDEDVLQEAKSYLKAEASLNFLTRDFNMSRSPNITASANVSGVLADADDVLQGLLDQLAGSGINFGGRRLQQTTVRPNDPFYTNGSQYYIDRINATGAWSYTTGAAEVVVAILDTGVDLDHPDIKDNLWVNRREIPGNGIDDDGNGYIDDIYGWDFAGNCLSYDSVQQRCTSCGPRNMPYPRDPHGTHVAGLVAAIQNNGQGITGVAPNVKIMVLRVSDCIQDSIAASNVVKAMDYAARMGAHIVSCSFGNSYDWSFSPIGPAPTYHADWINTYNTAIKPLANKNILVVAAAGNENINVDNLFNLGWAYSPCLIQQPNVVCVGGTDTTDNRAFFSNFGSQRVHVGAPGLQIYSLLWRNGTTSSNTHIYGPLNGTSMATPIVSGVAALALSLLGAPDRNYYRASQVKDVIMSTATKPSGLNLPWLTGSRVNAGMTMWRSSRIMSTVLTPMSPLYNITPGLPQVARFAGMSEIYYNAVGNQFSSEINGGVRDVSARNVTASLTPTSFTSYKFNANHLVSLTGFMRIDVSGIWGVQVKTTMDPRSYWVNMNGQTLTMNTTTQTGVFTATAPGWYNFELRIAYPQDRVDLMFKAPNSASYVYYDNFVSLAPAYTPHDFAPNIPMSKSFQVWYNKINTTTSPITRATVYAASPTSTYQYSTVVQDIGFSSAQWGPALFPGDSTATAAVGFIQTWLQPQTWTGPVVFRVLCKGCQLSINGLVVLDAFESLTLPTALTKSSSCVTLLNGMPNLLTISFANAPLTASPFTLQWSYCAANSFTQVSTVVTNPLVWNPVEAATQGWSGYVGGVQCDVYRSASGNLTTAITAQTSTPTWKVRVPRCPGDETLASTCTSPWSFSLETLLPGLSAASGPASTFAVRCWTYWKTGFSTSVISVLPNTPTSRPNLWLGGRAIMANGVPRQTSTVTNLPAFTQSLVVDWYNVSASTTLSVSQGASVLTMSLTDMLVPIGGIADYSGVDIMNKTLVAGSFGAYSATVYPTASDVAGLVHYELAPYYIASPKPVPAAADPQNGLDVTWTYPRVLGSRVRYTQAEGYFFSLGGAPQIYTIKLTESNASSTLIVMGNVTVRNAPAFNTASLPATSTFQVYLPAQLNIYTNVIVKTGRWDGRTAFYIETVPRPASKDPYEAQGPWNSFQWGRTTSAPIQ